jgi:hypothetical protein
MYVATRQLAERISTSHCLCCFARLHIVGEASRRVWHELQAFNIELVYSIRYFFATIVTHEQHVHNNNNAFPLVITVGC